jgi:hypothetical protein
MSDLRTAISEFTDEQLLHEYRHEQKEYTPEAFAVIREEIARRGLQANADSVEPDGEPLELNPQDFIAFDHSFSRTDLLFASAVLRENNIPFFPDNPSSTPTIPTENVANQRFTIRVHSTFAGKAHELLDEHFIKADNRYLLKYTGSRERLKVFIFADIHLSEQEAAEELEVGFSAQEKEIIITLGQRLTAEADKVEAAQDRVLFYYDSIEPLLMRLQEPGRTTLTRSDLLTTLEIPQVYADDPALPASMDEAVAQLLSFFLKT